LAKLPHQKPTLVWDFENREKKIGRVRKDWLGDVETIFGHGIFLIIFKLFWHGTIATSKKFKNY
jgi:hypothetical protein